MGNKMGNKMLIIDGVEYQEWEPPKERHHFEPIVSEHAKDIFGKQSEYFDTKQKLKSLSGIGSIPDGYVIILGDSPHWHVVEVELSSHPPHEHIVPQLHRFTLGIKNPSTQRDIVKAIYSKVVEDAFLKLRLQNAIGPVEIHMFLTDLISQPPILTIIIEKYTPVLREALSIFRDYQTEVVEFQTFTRERIGLPVHAHLFEPLYRPVAPTEPKPPISLEVPVIGIEIEVQDSYRKYSYIGIKKGYRSLFPNFGETIELTTDDGDVFAAKVGSSSGSMELWDLRERQSLREWYDRNRHLKKGDRILITPIGPKKYHLQIIKSERESF